MSTSTTAKVQAEAIVALAVKRLSWLTITGIAALSILAYAAVLVAVEHYWPRSSQFAQAIGHVAITIGVVVIVRKLEAKIITQDRAELISAIQLRYDSILQSDLPLLASTNAIGLTHVYNMRMEATKAIDEAILATKETLLMVGVAFFETFSIEHKCGQIAEIIVAHTPKAEDPKVPGRNFDARFLLLSPFTTPAVIRSLMESPPRRCT